MNMAEEILDGIEEKYSVYVEETGEDIVFELVVFDSENIDSNNLMGNRVWGGEWLKVQTARCTFNGFLTQTQA